MLHIKTNYQHNAFNTHIERVEEEKDGFKLYSEMPNIRGSRSDAVLNFHSHNTAGQQVVSRDMQITQHANKVQRYQRTVSLARHSTRSLTHITFKTSLTF